LNIDMALLNGGGVNESGAGRRRCFMNAVGDGGISSGLFETSATGVSGSARLAVRLINPVKKFITPL